MQKRRSSRGNPYHVPAGSPKGGQFTTANRQNVVVQNSDAYYEARTQLRNGEISQEDFQQRISSEHISNTPSYDMFVESLPQKPNVSTHEAKQKLFEAIVGATGDKVNVPINKTQGKQTTGSVKWKVHLTGTDEPYQEAVSVTISDAHPAPENNAETIYHEAFHFCANGGHTDEYDAKGKANGENRKMEEVMAVCSSYALLADTGYDMPKGMGSYAKDLVQTLPLLRHNTSEYKDCHTMEDIGRIAWDKRICSRDISWTALSKEAKSKSLPKDYYKGYVSHMESNAQRYINDLWEDYMAAYPKSDSSKIKRIITESYFSGVQQIKDGVSPKKIKKNEGVIVNRALCKAMHDIGIL